MKRQRPVSGTRSKLSQQRDELSYVCFVCDGASLVKIISHGSCNGYDYYLGSCVPFLEVVEIFARGWIESQVACFHMRSGAESPKTGPNGT